MQPLILTDATARSGLGFLEQRLRALIPKETLLLSNYPNPFNPETWIPYQLAEPAVYWDGKNEQGEPVASGIYLYTLTACDFSATRRMLVGK